MPKLLALLDGDHTEPTVFSSWAAPVRQRTLQNCGHSFFAKYERTGGSDGGAKGSGGDSGSDDGRGRSNTTSPESKKKRKEKKGADGDLKLADCLKGVDLYKLLDIDDGASQDDLKKAYRKVCLTHHPDKHAHKSEEEITVVNLEFVKIQEAYNLLNDTQKRRKYDSLGEFDEWVPTTLGEDQDFFEVFEPVFKKEARWSEQKPVPFLGKADTSYDKVRSFYEFWLSFQSWRDLDAQIIEECGEDCFQSTEDAECREERRWMEKENSRIRKKFIEAERKRVFDFVEVAEKHDPRVRAEKDRLWEIKEATKIAKEAKKLEAEKKAQEEEAKKEKAAEREKIAQAVAKAQKADEAKVRKNKRASLRTMVKDLNLGLAEERLQDFLLAISQDETESLTEEIKGGGQGEVVFAAMRAKGVEPVVLSKEAQDEKSTDEGSPSEQEAPKTPEELKRLEKERQKREKDLERRRKKEEEADAVRKAEEKVVKDAEKLVKDAKKKVDQEKRDKENQKNAKKEAEKVKREEEKKVKDEEKAVEKVRLEKENQKKASSEQSLKQKAEKEAETEAKLLEKRTFEFERDRMARVEAFEKAVWPPVAEAQAAVANAMVASALAAAWADEKIGNDPEELLDAQLACLGSFFVFGISPKEDALALSGNLRSKVKKIRNKIRNSAIAGDFVVEAPASAVADSALLQQFILAADGNGPEPTAAVAVAAEAEAAPAADAAKGKKKKSVKAVPEEEDLDALLAEFGCSTDGKKKKNKSKK